MKSLVLLAILLLAVFTIQPLNAKIVDILPGVHYVFAADNSTNNSTNTTQPIPAVGTHEFTIDRSCYNITKIIVTFPYVNSNHTIEAVSTIGPSAYSYDFSTTGGASGIFTFIADDVDVYSFTVRIAYENSTQRDLLISIWQGDLIMESYTWTETGMQYIIHFRLNEIEEPHVPDKESIAQQVLYDMQLWLQQILTKQTDQLNTMQQANQMNSFISAGAAIAAIVAVLLAGFGARRRRMNPE